MKSIPVDQGIEYYHVHHCACGAEVSRKAPSREDQGQLGHRERCPLYGVHL